MDISTPIVLTAFGTTTKAMDTYDYMDKIIRERFSNHKIEWAYSSRMVRDFSKKRENIDLKSPNRYCPILLLKVIPGPLSSRFILSAEMSLIVSLKRFSMYRFVRQ